MQKKLFAAALLGCFLLLSLFCCGCSESKPVAPEDPINDKPNFQESSVAPDKTNPQGDSALSDEISPEAAARNLLSAYFAQETPMGICYWEFETDNKDDLKQIEALFSTDNLEMLNDGGTRWPDGGMPVIFTLSYDQEKIDGCVYPQAVYRIKNEDDRTTLRLGEIYYNYPEDRCDDLLSFLAGKNIEVD